MARYTGPKCRLCRREGVKLFLKGARCESEKCAVTRRAQAPGQHGNTRRRRTQSGYLTQLREKQKVKRIYGVLEKQFSNYVKRASREQEVTGEALMQMLESRLDNVIYRVGFALSRSQSRQFLRFGYFAVNGNKVTIPSYRVKPGDVVTVLQPDRISLREVAKLPEWINFSKDELKAELLAYPTTDQLRESEVEINPQLIVEYYSR